MFIFKIDSFSKFAHFTWAKGTYSVTKITTFAHGGISKKVLWHNKWKFKPKISPIFHFEYVNEVWISGVLGVKAFETEGRNQLFSFVFSCTLLIIVGASVDCLLTCDFLMTPPWFLAVLATLIVWREIQKNWEDL